MLICFEINTKVHEIKRTINKKIYITYDIYKTTR